jgi:SAM-dependent methyltransferase
VTARVLEPELLDELAADDPRAVVSRRDLVRVNGIMRQQAIMAGLLRRLEPPRVMADLGSGDGRFLLGVAARLKWRGVTALVMDRQNIVSAQTRARFAALGWRCETVQGDVFDSLAGLEADIVTANLFLHHLDDAALARLLTLAAAKTRAFIATEPRRSMPALLGSHLLFALACNDVTRHDAVASVRAGFSGREISRLWPQNCWALHEGRALPFTHIFTARRDAV